MVSARSFSGRCCPGELLAKHESLLDESLGGQIGWLLPLAFIGLLVTSLQSGWRNRFDRRHIRLALDVRQQSLVVWGVWLLTQTAFFSVAGFFHPYYLVMLAPAVAALSGPGRQGGMGGAPGADGGSSQPGGASGSSGGSEQPGVGGTRPSGSAGGTGGFGGGERMIPSP